MRFTHAPATPPTPGGITGDGSLQIAGGFYGSVGISFNTAGGSPQVYNSAVSVLSVSWPGESYSSGANVYFQGNTVPCEVTLQSMGEYGASGFGPSEGSAANHITRVQGGSFADTTHQHVVNVQGNAVPQQDIDALLGIAAGSGANANGCSLTLDGGTNAEPSGTGWGSYDTAITNGWTIAVNGTHPS